MEPSLSDDAASVGEAVAARGGSPAEAAREAQKEARAHGASEADASKAAGLAAAAAVSAKGGTAEEAARAAAEAAQAAGASAEEAAEIAGEAAGAAVLAKGGSNEEAARAAAAGAAQRGGHRGQPRPPDCPQSGPTGPCPLSHREPERLHKVAVRLGTVVKKEVRDIEAELAEDKSLALPGRSVLTRKVVRSLGLRGVKLKAVHSAADLGVAEAHKAGHGCCSLVLYTNIK